MKAEEEPKKWHGKKLREPLITDLYIIWNNIPNTVLYRRLFFYDPSSGDEIDFVHMIATLNANSFDRFGMGVFDDSLNTYAGWAGDLITLAGDVQELYTFDSDVVQTVIEFLSDLKKVSHFSNSDLLADIDAVLICDSLGNMPIYQAIELYYQSDYKNRYNLFLEKEFYGYTQIAELTAKSFLSFSTTTEIFKDMFDSSYSRRIVPDVAKGFSEYIGSQARR